jgi:hypothetical protein
MDHACQESGCTFVVVVIPTKESVFAKYLGSARPVEMQPVIERVVENESLGRFALFQFMRDANIAYVDALPALSREVGRELYARTTADMHPSKNGYRVIGDAVAQFIMRIGVRD